MTETTRFFHEIVDIHRAIERWFTGRAEPAELVPLLARFSPTFQMVSMQGNTLGKEEVAELFGRMHGKRPELRISIDQMDTSHEWPGGVCLTYRETHADSDGFQTVRRSTVLLEASADGSLQWRHLHETPVASLGRS
ncbi:DUF4440 domain-containing protein [Phyllobacterium myrsinacearum]|uniref:DUF4440 domain-containing protein n=1 Tax=Phyllobacterium myrsinacearum TaxID=28101 RepID=A0A839EPW3_9HYPH|nr:DUF4440 domain-containing protein [Phyllobacterium myrsinacearum]MBA8880919.1 hypothetical protein [Phyllobacterium myrsinacearum]